MPGVIHQVFQFDRVLFQVEELLVDRLLFGVADVLPPLRADAFRDPDVVGVDVGVLEEGVVAYFLCFVLHERAQAQALHAFRNGHARVVEHGGRPVDVQGHGLMAHATPVLRQTAVPHDEGHADGSK